MIELLALLVFMMLSLYLPADTSEVKSSSRHCKHPSVLQNGTSNGPWWLNVLWWDPAVSNKVPTVPKTVIQAFTMSLCHLDFLWNALKRYEKVSSLY